MTPKEIFEIAKHLSVEDQQVWLHINCSVAMLSNPAYVAWVRKYANLRPQRGDSSPLLPAVAKFLRLPKEERERWRDAVIARAHKITLETVQHSMRAKPKARKYSVNVPLTTWLSEDVLATGPEEAIAIAIEGYDPDMKDFAFALEGDKATVEDASTGELVWPTDKKET